MADHMPFKGLEIPYLSKDQLESFEEPHYIAHKFYSWVDSLEPSHQVSESRRLIMLMALAARLVFKQPPEVNQDLFIGTSREITQKDAGQEFKRYVENYPELNACIDHFRLKLEKEDQTGGDYLNQPVKALESSELYRISKGQYFTPRMFAKRLVSRAEDDYKPIAILESLGTYFDYQLVLREQRMEAKSGFSNRPPQNDGPQ